LDASAPQTLRELTGSRQRTPEELIDRYDLACRPVRDLLVDYLKERQPALDYSSLRKLSAALAGGFWKDLERHHPGSGSLHLPAQVSEAWKQRLRSRQKTIVTGTGAKAAVTVERISYRQCLTPVRAFYLDLAQWAIEEPGRWAAWAVPCPVGAEEINQRKAARHRKSRMDARTRERLPVLPVLVRAVDERRKNAGELLQAARQARPGETFMTVGQTLTRLVTTRPASGKIWADDPVTGKRRDLAVEEDLAFWAWAAVEILRMTGVRVEELPEISHHSLVQYRQPGTGELIPLLQIVPSKTDTERLLVVSPELADVLSVIIRRIRGDTEAVPLVRAYDRRECLWIGPAPLLFQRRFGADNRRICDSTIRNMLNAALAGTGLTDHADGSPLHYSPHDFRRIFITDAIMSGLPPHIAQIIAGHQDLNVTMGYRGRLPRRGDPGPPGVPGPPPVPAAQRGIPRPHRGGMGRVPRPQGSSARSRPAPAAARSAPRASTSTAAFAAACTGPRPPSGPASLRSATTSPPASPKPDRKAGTAKPKDSRSAWPAQRTSSPRSTGDLRPQDQSASACPPSPVSARAHPPAPA